MTPPGGAGNRDNGHGVRGQRSAEIIEFPGSTPESPPESGPTSSSPPNSTIPPAVRPAPSWEQFTDFNSLLNLTQGRSGLAPAGPYGRVQLYLETLANASLNQGYDADLVRNGQHYHLSQEKPGDPIRVRFSQERPQLRPKFEIIYYPDGRIGHSSTFDPNGRIQGERVFEGPERLRSAALSDHTSLLDFLSQRQTQLGKSFGAFRRLAGPLQQLRPSQLDPGNQATWYRNFVVLNGEVYSIQTQKLGFSAFEQFPSQNQIAIFKQEGARFVEVLRISQTGEINYDSNVSARQLPTTRQLELLREITNQVEVAQRNPATYQESLHQALKTVSESLSVEIEAPRVELTQSPATEIASTRGILGEPILEITSGRDLLRQIRLGFPQTHRWENPENPNDVRQLQPHGSIRRAMAWELVRWFGSTLWHGTINDVRNLKPKAGSLRLHLQPDGSADLEIHRNYDRTLSDGTVTHERGIYNYLRRTAEGATIDLGDVVKQMSKGNPQFADLPRARQLTLAARTISDAVHPSHGLEIQEMPPIRISNLELSPSWLQPIVDRVLRDSPQTSPESVPKGPRTAAQAAEIIQRLPELQGRRARVASETTPLGRETFFEFDFPSSHPQTRIEVSEEAHQSGKRVIVRLWQGQGGEVATAVYDEGTFNHHESIRLNMAELARAQQGFRQPSRLFRVGKLMLQRYTYGPFYGFAYGVGHALSFPAAWAYEGAFWSEGERQAFGTPYPDISFGALARGVGDFATMMGGAGFGAILVDGTFNYTGGLWNAFSDWRRSGVTWREAYQHHAPRILNAPPIRHRPIPKQLFYLRNFLQRGVPLFAGLLSLEILHNGGIRGLNWSRLGQNTLRIGAVSFGTAGLWALASRRTELAIARRAAEQPIRGLGGFLLRNRLLTRAAPGVSGARLSMTYRATLLTVILEMAILRIWDSHDRRQQFLAQEGNFRNELSRALDRRNRMMSRLEFGEAVPPQQIWRAQQEVEGAYQRYRSFLNILERNDGDSQTRELPLANAYGDVFEEYERQSLALQGLQGPYASNLLGRARFTRNQQLRDLRSGEHQTRERLNRLYESHHLPVVSESDGEGLREWLARTTQILQNDPQALDRVRQSQEHPGTQPAGGVASPVSLTSSAGREIIDHINWQISENPSFLTWNRSRQAQWILDEFSGYRVTDSHGEYRPWNLAEASAFLSALDLENTRRSERLEAPLTSARGSQEHPDRNLEEVATQEDRILADADVGNMHLGQIRSVLADNIPDLDRQMEGYNRRINQRIDHALLQFMPPELFAMGPGSSTGSEPHSASPAPI